MPLDQAAIARDGDLDNSGAVVLRLEAMADEAPRAIAADARVLAEIGSRYIEIVHRQATGQAVTDEELAAFDLDLVAYGEAAESVTNYARTTCGIDLNTR